MYLMCCNAVIALTLPTIRVKRPQVSLAKFLMMRNWSVSCENRVSTLFLAYAKGMKAGFQFF